MTESGLKGSLRASRDSKAQPPASGVSRKVFAFVPIVLHSVYPDRTKCRCLSES